MIISHEHKYVYIALPRTGSTAVEKELLAEYAGQRIMNKHSTYGDFLKKASEEERRYFAFSSIRNPLDDAVSRYFKIRTDHNSRYTDPVRRRYRVGNVGAEAMRKTGRDRQGRRPAKRAPIELMENRHFDYIRRTGADFPTYFKRYYRLPHDTWARLDHDRLDFVIRFESIDEDFDTALDLIGVRKTRPLPAKNTTSKKDRDFGSYYTPEVIPRAKWVFGPYMRRWGYLFPEGWGDERHPRLADAVLGTLSVPRRLYWKVIR